MAKILIGIVCKVAASGSLARYGSARLARRRSAPGSLWEFAGRSFRLNYRHVIPLTTVGPALARDAARRYRNAICHFIRAARARDRSIVIVNYNMKFRRVNSAPLDTSLHNDPIQ